MGTGCKFAVGIDSALQLSHSAPLPNELFALWRTCMSIDIVASVVLGGCTLHSLGNRVAFLPFMLVKVMSQFTETWTLNGLWVALNPRLVHPKQGECYLALYLTLILWELCWARGQRLHFVDLALCCSLTLHVFQPLPTYGTVQRGGNSALLLQHWVGSTLNGLLCQGEPAHGCLHSG